MRKPSASSVRQDSLPQCLRHISPGCALNDADALAAFLQSATTALLADEVCATDQDIYGLQLCFDLLRDKIAIGTGERPFPLCGNAKDTWLPPLWTPSDGGDDHE